MNLLVTFSDSSTKVYNRDDIKSLNIKLECDPTIATIPVCEFDAEVLDTEHNESDFRTAQVKVRDDERTSGGTLFELTCNYHIVDTSAVSNNVYYFKAQSVLAKLDNYKLSQRYYGNTRGSAIIEDIFTECGWTGEKPYSIQSSPQWLDQDFSGLLPEQTARERLLWVMQAGCCVVEQWGSFQWGTQTKDRLFINDAKEMSSWGYSDTWNIVCADEIFNKPVIKTVDSVNCIRYRTYDSWTDTTPYDPNDYENFQYLIRYDPATGQPIYSYYYAMKYDHVLGSVGGKEVQIYNNNLMNELIEDAYDWMLSPYTKKYEVQLDVIDYKKSQSDGAPSRISSLLPNRFVKFALDKETFSIGVIKRVEYVIGALNRIRLTVLTTLEPVAARKCTIRCVYFDGYGRRLLASIDFSVPEGNGRLITLPDIEAYIVDRLEKFYPQIRTTFLNSDSTILYIPSST